MHYAKRAFQHSTWNWDACLQRSELTVLSAKILKAINCESSILVGTFYKEKALVEAFFRHCKTSRSSVDSFNQYSATLHLSRWWQQIAPSKISSATVQQTAAVHYSTTTIPEIASLTLHRRIVFPPFCLKPRDLLRMVITLISSGDFGER